MAEHIIPEHEKEKHTPAEDCICEPKFHLDEESGELVWEHQVLDWVALLDDFISY